VQGDSAASVFGGFGYTRFLRENLAVTFAVDGIAVSSGINISSTLAATGTAAALSIPAGIRWNPLRGDHTTQALKPFVAVGIGPVIGIADASFVSGLAVSADQPSARRSAGRWAAASTCSPADPSHSG